MINTKYNKHENLLTVHLTNFVGTEDIFKLLDCIEKHQVYNESIEILVYAQCEKTSINPAQIYQWANSHFYLLKEFKSINIAIVSTRPVFVALSQIFRQQYNGNQINIEVFSEGAYALNYLAERSVISKE